MALKTSAVIVSEAGSLLPDNTTELISAEDVRVRVVDLAESTFNLADNPQASSGELEALTETALRAFSPADLQRAMRRLQDLDNNTTVEVERSPDQNYIYLKAGGVDMVEVRSTQALVGNASTGVKVEIGVANLITLDGEVNLVDFPNTRSDGTSTKAFYADPSGNLRYGTINTSAGSKVEDTDADTYLEVDAGGLDNDTVVIYAAGAQRGTISATTVQLGNHAGLDTNILLSGSNLNFDFPLGGNADFFNSNGDGLYMNLTTSGTPAANFTGTEMRFSAYPSTRDDGSTSIAFYPDSLGRLRVGAISGAGGGGTSVEDGDGDTKIQTDEGALDDDTIRFDADGTEVMTITSTSLNVNIGSQRLDLGSSASTLGRDNDNVAVSMSGETITHRLNAINVAQFSLLATSTAPRVRLGDYGGVNNSTVLEVDDNAQTISASPGGNQRLLVGAASWELGENGADYTAQDGTSFRVYNNNTQSLEVLDGQVIAGANADTSVHVNHATGGKYVRGYSQGKILLEINEAGTTGQVRVGDYAELNPTYLQINADTDQINGYSNGSQFLAVTASQVDVGHGTTTVRVNASANELRASGRLVGSFGQTLQTVGDSASAGNGVRLEVDDTGQTIKARFGASTLLSVDKANDLTTAGNATTYVEVDSSVTDRIRLEAGTILLDQFKAQEDTEQDFALTLDASGNLNRAHINAKHCVPVSISAESGDLAASTSTPVLTMHMPYKFRLEEVIAGVSTAPTGAALLFDIHQAGTTIFSTRVQIDATEDNSTTAATAYVFSAGSTVTINKADKLEFFIDQIGSTVAGEGAKIYLIGTIIL